MSEDIHRLSEYFNDNLLDFQKLITLYDLIHFGFKGLFTDDNGVFVKKANDTLYSSQDIFKILRDNKFLDEIKIKNIWSYFYNQFAKGDNIKIFLYLYNGGDELLKSFDGLNQISFTVMHSSIGFLDIMHPDCMNIEDEKLEFTHLITKHKKCINDVIDNLKIGLEESKKSQIDHMHITFPKEQGIEPLVAAKVDLKECFIPSSQIKNILQTSTEELSDDSKEQEDINKRNINENKISPALYDLNKLIYKFNDCDDYQKYGENTQQQQIKVWLKAHKFTDKEQHVYARLISNHYNIRTKRT